jgi:hypothetical protein
MTKYLTEERFIVQSNSKEAIKNYKDNFDRIFGEKKEETSAAQAVREHLAAGGERSPIGWYGVVTLPSEAKPSDEPCEMCGVPGGEWCKDDCSETPKPKTAIVQMHHDNTGTTCRHALKTVTQRALAAHDACHLCNGLARTL